MNTRLDETTTTEDRIVRGIIIVTAVITIVGVLALIRAATGNRVHQVPAVRVQNRAALPLQVDALDPTGARISLGKAKPGSLSNFHEIPDVGPTWTLVATYGGEEVHRETLARTELAAANWTIVIPADATRALEQAGFQ